MSNKLITAEVREAIARAINPAAFDPQTSNGDPDWIGWEVQRRAAYRYADAALSVLPALIEKAREEEREACAKIADRFGRSPRLIEGPLGTFMDYRENDAAKVARQIRARTQPKTQEPTP